MPYVNDFFSAFTTQRLSATDVYLPLDAAAHADLLRFTTDGNYTYASLVDDTTMETVIIHNDHGTLIMERGREGTPAVAHPPGTCIHTVSPTIIAAIKDLICNWECCKNSK